MPPIRTPTKTIPADNAINTRSKSVSSVNKESDSSAILNEISDTLKVVIEELKKQKNQLKRHEVLLNEIKICVDCDKNVNSDLSKQIKKIIEEDVNKKVSYVDKLKEKESSLIIVPKKLSQKSEVTKKVVKDNINPVDSGATGMRSAAKGAIILECKNKETSATLKDEVTQKLGEDYSVKALPLKNPRFKIINMSEKLSEDIIIENIKKQNDFINKNAEFKVIKMLETKKGRYTEYCAIIETDANSFDRIIQNEKISIGWDRCKVYEHIFVSRCFKCLGFSHAAKDCNRTQACINCGGEHNKKDCTVNEPNCVNCSWAVKNLNIKLDTKHSSLSIICPVLQKRKDRERNKMNVSK